MSPILGHIEKDGPVIIDRCYHMSRKRNIAHGELMESDVILAYRAIVGLLSDQDTSPSFNAVTFSVEGIDEWVGVSGIKISTQSKKSDLTISYNVPENVTLNLENGMQLLITFAWTPPDIPSTKRAEVTQKVYFKLISQKPHELDIFISIAEKIAAFLCFIMDEIVCLERVKAAPSAKIYCSSWPYSTNEPKIREFRMLFRFKKIQHRAESVINSWIENYEQIAPAVNLYFLTKTGRISTIDLQFLTLAQALEAFHRRTCDETHMDKDKFEEIRKILIKACPRAQRNWFAPKLNYANELTLRNRLQRMIKPFNDFMGGDYSPKLVNSIINTRNYLTHYDPDLEEKAAEGQSLEFLILKMNALFRLHFLKLIGFDEEEIGSIVNECSSLRGACSMIDQIYVQA